jgi:carnitine O-palmitoyltransferase 1
LKRVLSSQVFLKHFRFFISELSHFKAARLTFTILKYQQFLEEEKKAPHYMNSKSGQKVPLDMSQYNRLYTTVRIPGKEGDSIITMKPSPHVVVICRHLFYKLDLVHKNGVPLTCKDIEIQMQRILEDSSKRPQPKISVGVRKSNIVFTL